MSAEIELDMIDATAAAEAAEQDQPAVLGPDGMPARVQREGQSCISCAAAGSFVKPVLGGGCVCMKCGYQE